MRKMCECGIASECNIEFSVALLNSLQTPSNLPCCVYVCVFEFECVCVCHTYRTVCMVCWEWCMGAVWEHNSTVMTADMSAWHAR